MLMGNSLAISGDPAPGDDTPEKAPGRAEFIKAETKDGALSLKCTAETAAAYDAAFGSTSTDFQNYATAQLVNILTTGTGKGPNSDVTRELNSALAMLSGIAPQSEMEAMLAVQAVAAHHCGLRAMQRHGNADTLELMEAHGLMANRFFRTFTIQMEALAKLRRGGKQIVEHVHVYPGGQAVIAGTVNSGGKGA